MDMAEEHYMCFGQYINSIKEVISKIPSNDKGNTNIILRVDQDQDWRSFKNNKTLYKKTKRIFFRDDENEEPSSEK